MTDIATLLIATHGALQIFRPTVSSLDIGDGLYEYQNYCFAIIILLPITLASISFVNPGPAYTAQGAFCSLPTSPIWYRIALSYAPRYLIGLIVVSLSIAVYVHVELKFRSFAKLQRSSRTSIAFPAGQSPGAMVEQEMVRESQQARRGSLPILSTPNYGDRTDEPSTAIQPQSPKTTRSDFSAIRNDVVQGYFPAPMESAAPAGRKISIITTGSRDTVATSNRSRVSLPVMAAFKRTHSALQRLTAPANGVAPQLTAMQKQVAERKALRRQLRLIFVYPIVYVVLWIPPCTLNAMQYSSKYAGHLPPWLGALSNVCLTLMGGIDCIVFFWREKPWRRTRSRTNSGSLHWNSTTSSRDPEKGGSGTTSTQAETSNRASVVSNIGTTILHLLPRKPTPAGTATTVAKQRAYERLALEIKDRREQARQPVDAMPVERAPDDVSDNDHIEMPRNVFPGKNIDGNKTM